MKRVKLMSVALVALSMVAVTSVNAQPQPREPKSADEMAKMMTERMTKSLELSEDQASKIYDINLKYTEERQAKAEAMKAEREEKRAERGDEAPEKRERPMKGEESAKEGGRRPMPQAGGEKQRGGNQQEMMESKKAMTKEIIAVLNDDQIVEYIEMQVKMAGRQPQGGRPGMQRGSRQQHGPQHGPKGGPQGGRRGGPQGGDCPEQGPMCDKE